jgi:TRAP transporter TAXI family solute receptor
MTTPCTSLVLWLRLAAFAFAIALALPACGGKQSDQRGAGETSRLSIATGNTTGVYYQLGGAYARVISRNTGHKTTASETGASVQNIQLITAGKQDIAFSLLDTAADAVEGKGAFEGKPQPIEALTALYPNFTHVVARNGSGIASIADMKGKRVSTGSPQSGTEVIANRLLLAAGLDPEKDIKRQRLALDKTVESMKDGALDALFWSGGLPTPGIKDLFTARKGKVRLLDISQLRPQLNQQYGDFYEAGSISADTYGANETATIRVTNLLLVKTGFDPALAERLVRALFDHRSDLEAATPAAKDIAIRTATRTQPVALNPGAKKALDALAAEAPSR